MSIRTNLNAIKEQVGITNHVILRHGLDINKAKDKIENLNYFNSYFSFEKVDGKLYVDRFKIEMCENPKVFTRNYHDSGNLHTEVDGNIIVSIENNAKVVFNEGLKKGSDTIQLEEEDATQIAEEFQEVGYLFKKLDIEGMIAHDTSFFREFYGQEAFKGYINKVLDAYHQIEYTDEIKKDEAIFVVDKKVEDEVFQKQLKAAEEIYQEKFNLFRHHEIKMELATNIKDTEKADALRLELYKSIIENRYNHINQQWGNYMDLSLSNDPESCKKYIDNFVTQSAEIINNVAMRSVDGKAVELSDTEKEVLQDNAIKIEYLTAYLKVHPDSKENQIPKVEFTKEYFDKVRDPDEMLVEEGKSLFGVIDSNGKKFANFVNFGGSFEKIDLEINKLKEEQNKNKDEIRKCLVEYIIEKNAENRYKEEMKKNLDEMSKLNIIGDKDSLSVLTNLFNDEDKDKQKIEETLNKLTNSAKDEDKQILKDFSDKLIKLVNDENDNKTNIKNTENRLRILSNTENDKKLEFLERYKEACSFQPSGEELRRGSLFLQEDAESILKDPSKCFAKYEDILRNKEDAENKIKIYNENKDKAKDDKTRNPEIDNIKIQNEVDRFDIANKQLVFLKDYMTKQSMGAEKYEQFMKETDVSDVKIKKQTPVEKLVSEYKQKLERDFGFVDKVELENRRFGLHKMHQMTEEKMKKEIPVYEVNDIVNNINAKQFEKDDLLSLNKRIIKDFSSEQAIANSCEFSRNLQHIVEKGTLSQYDVDLVVDNTSAINQWQDVEAQFDADKFITVKYKKETLTEMGQTVQNICEGMSDNGRAITYEKIKDIDSLNHFVDDYKVRLEDYKDLYNFSKNVKINNGDPLAEFKQAFKYAATSYEDAQKSMEDYIKLQDMASKLDKHTYDVFIRENLPETTSVKYLSAKDNQTALLHGIEEFKQEKVNQAIVANDRINELVNPDNGESLKQHVLNLNELADNLNKSYKVYKDIETKEADNLLTEIEKNYKDKYKEQYYNAVEEYTKKSVAVSEYIDALGSNLEKFDRTKTEVENEFKTIEEVRDLCLQEYCTKGEAIILDDDDKLSKQLSEINPENSCSDINKYLDINKSEDGVKIDLKLDVELEISHEECNKVLKEIEEERLNSKDKEDDYELDL